MFQKFYFLFSCNWVLNQWVLWKFDMFPSDTMLLSFIANFFGLTRSHVYSEFRFVPSVSDFSPWFFTCFLGPLSGCLLRSTVPSRGVCETLLVISICLPSFSIPLPIYCCCFQPFTWFFSIQGPSSLSNDNLDSFSFWHWVLSKAFSDLFGKLL